MGLLFSLSTSALLTGAVAAAIANPGEWATLTRECKSGINSIGSVARPPVQHLNTLDLVLPSPPGVWGLGGWGW